MGLEHTHDISSEDRHNKSNIDSTEHIDSKDYLDPMQHINHDNFVIVLDNKPFFTDDDKNRLKDKPPIFSFLDESLDKRRCGTAIACIDKNTVEHGNRPRIKSTPPGFPQDKKYINLIFQRCHLIGCQLLKKRENDKDDENANLKRIFTGTCFMNNIMYYYEKQVADYVRKKDNYVLYRVTPYFGKGYQLVYGVQIEAKFFNKEEEEDRAKSFNVFVHNKQPGIVIKHKTGEIFKPKSIDIINKMLKTENIYVLNKRKKRFHLRNCASMFYSDKKIKDDRNQDQLVKAGYCPCPICDPVIRLKALKM